MYYIHFYSRQSGGLSKKHGYKSTRDAERDLRQNGFENRGSGVWERADYIARIKEEKNG